MAKSPLPSIDQIRQLIRLDRNTGRLYWLPRSPSQFEGSNERICRTWNARYADQPALNNKRVQGYLGGSLLGQYIAAHRVVWALAYGAWPEKFIDHINHDRADNRLSNLRLVSNQENCRNQRLGKSNVSGSVGVYWVPAENKWKAKIGHDHLGTFSSKSDAIAARKKAEASYGFHINHGK
tara:strand:- start:3336 stop:3875 length:540 start_codon:yes stop_codon:yes gene_type:complete